MTMRRFEVSVVTASDGSATAYTPYLTGYVQDVQYVKTDFADGSTFAITDDANGRTIWGEANVNASAIRAPRQPTHTTAGAASLYASGGVAVNDRIAIGQARIKIVISSGGNVKSGKFVFLVDDNH